MTAVAGLTFTLNKPATTFGGEALSDTLKRIVVAPAG